MSGSSVVDKKKTKRRRKNIILRYGIGSAEENSIFYDMIVVLSDCGEE